ncbi:MAG: hypothetical protein HRU20_19650 [Pseudomonadales bacterium]|nr:hypothetical protein [Pseudomonadales bacterium]
MNILNSNVTSIDKPRCSQCGVFKDHAELNGYDPFAPVGQKYKDAYCTRLSECNSDEARGIIDDLVKHLED